MEGQGPSISEDIRLVIVKALNGNLHILKEVVARSTNRMYHVQREH